MLGVADSAGLASPVDQPRNSYAVAGLPYVVPTKVGGPRWTVHPPDVKGRPVASSNTATTSRTTAPRPVPMLLVWYPLELLTGPKRST